MISKKAENQPKRSEIVNDKSKERETKSKLKEAEKVNDKNRPHFDENRPESLIDVFEDDSKLS